MLTKAGTNHLLIFPTLVKLSHGLFFFSHLSSSWETDLVWATQHPAEKIVFFDCFCGSLTHHSTPSARQESTLAAEAEVDHSMRPASFKYGWVQRPESSRDGWVLLSHILIYSGFLGDYVHVPPLAHLLGLGYSTDIGGWSNPEREKDSLCRVGALTIPIPYMLISLVRYLVGLSGHSSDAPRQQREGAHNISQNGQHALTTAAEHPNRLKLGKRP